MVPSSADEATRAPRDVPSGTGPRRSPSTDGPGAFSLRGNWRHLVTRPPASMPALDGLRALSILWVILFHSGWFLSLYLPPAEFRPLAADPLLRLVWCGDLGVDIFFVMSGFLIADQLLQQLEATRSLSVKRFYLHRAMRLLPAYAVVLSLYCRLGLPHCDTAWANLLYVNNLLPIERQCMGWSWSLAVEAQFYLLLPPILLLGWPLPSPLRSRLLLCLAAAAFAIPLGLAAAEGLTLPVPFFPSLDRPAFERFFDTLYDKPYTRFGGLLFGALAAGLRRSAPVLRGLEVHRALASVAAALAVLLAAFICLYPSKDPDRTGAPGLLSVVYLGASRPAFSLAVAYLLLLSLSAHPVGRGLSRALACRCWYPVAQLSYSSYLLHPICIVVVLDLLRPAGVPSHAALLGYALLELALVLVSAGLLYLLVERPFMNLRSSRHFPWAPGPLLP